MEGEFDCQTRRGDIVVVVNGVSGGYLNNKMRTRENKTNKNWKGKQNI